MTNPQDARIEGVSRSTDPSRPLAYFEAVHEAFHSAVQAVVKKEYFPNQFTVIPHDRDTATVGDESLTWHAVDTADYNVNLFHFASALGKPTSNVLFWAVTVVEVPRDMPGVRLAIGPGKLKNSEIHSIVK